MCFLVREERLRRIDVFLMSPLDCQRALRGFHRSLECVPSRELRSAIEIYFPRSLLIPGSSVLFFFGVSLRLSHDSCREAVLHPRGVYVDERGLSAVLKVFSFKQYGAMARARGMSPFHSGRQQTILPVSLSFMAISGMGSWYYGCTGSIATILLESLAVPTTAHQPIDKMLLFLLLSLLVTSNPWCWAGVECGVGCVEVLGLSGNQLQGELPGAALADIKSLVTLDLSDNEIQGMYAFVSDTSRLWYV